MPLVSLGGQLTGFRMRAAFSQDLPSFRPFGACQPVDQQCGLMPETRRFAGWTSTQGCVEVDDVLSQEEYASKVRTCVRHREWHR